VPSPSEELAGIREALGELPNQIASVLSTSLKVPGAPEAPESAPSIRPMSLPGPVNQFPKKEREEAPRLSSPAGSAPRPSAPDRSTSTPPPIQAPRQVSQPMPSPGSPVPTERPQAPYPGVGVSPGGSQAGGPPGAIGALMSILGQILEALKESKAESGPLAPSNANAQGHSGPAQVPKANQPSWNPMPPARRGPLGGASPAFGGR
jgi:hypothetical protein